MSSKSELNSILFLYNKNQTFLNRFFYIAKFLFRFFLSRVSLFCPNIKLRVLFAKWRGVKIGNDVYIGHNVEFDMIFPSLITIGDHCGIGSGVYISAHHSIPTETPLSKVYPREIQPVIIGKGVDVNLNVIIQPGVKIGDYSIIGNGAVVTKDIPPMTLAVGIPAKPIKDLSYKVRLYITNEEYNKLMKERVDIYKYI